MTAALFRQAGLLPHLPGTYLRSLDALHIVAALDTSQAAFVTYDLGQARAAAAAGLRVRLDPTYAPDAETVEVTSSSEKDEALEED